MIEINGMAHVVLTVSRFDEARAFYCELLPFLGMHRVFDGNDFVYHVGGRTALGVQRAAAELRGRALRPGPRGAAPPLPARALSRGRGHGGGRSCARWAP